MEKPETLGWYKVILLPTSHEVWEITLQWVHTTIKGSKVVKATARRALSEAKTPC